MDTYGNVVIYFHPNGNTYIVEYTHRNAKRHFITDGNYHYDLYANLNKYANGFKHTHPNQHPDADL
jgi:hypothetical protein